MAEIGTGVGLRVRSRSGSDDEIERARFSASALVRLALRLSFSLDLSLFFLDDSLEVDGESFALGRDSRTRRRDQAFPETPVPVSGNGRSGFVVESAASLGLARPRAPQRPA